VVRSFVAGMIYAHGLYIGIDDSEGMIHETRSRLFIDEPRWSWFEILRSLRGTTSVEFCFHFVETLAEDVAKRKEVVLWIAGGSTVGLTCRVGGLTAGSTWIDDSSIGRLIWSASDPMSGLAWSNSANYCALYSISGQCTALV
jgi:hypothetical protein